MRRATGPGDEHSQTAAVCAGCIAGEIARRPMRRDHIDFRFDSKLFASVSGFLHGRPIRIASHQNTYGQIFKAFVFHARKIIDREVKSHSFLAPKKVRKVWQLEGKNMIREAVQRHNGWRRLAEFLALRRNIALLLVALVLAGTGEKLWLVFAPKYLQTLGAGVFVIGLFDALQTLLGALYAYPGGWLTDRLGQRLSLTLFSAVSLAGYGLVLLWHHWLALVIGAFLFLAWSGFSLPATFTVVATSLQGSRHTMGIGVQSMVRRVPMMVGPLVGGWLITRFGWADGIHYALGGCIVLSLLTLLFQWGILDAVAGEPAITPLRGATLREVVRSFTPALRELLVSDILIRFCERLPYAWVIVWAVNNAGVSAQQYGVLVAIEMITAMICYIPVAHLADKHGRRSFVLVTFVFFTLFPLTLLCGKSFGWLALAFVVRGLK